MAGMDNLFNGKWAIMSHGNVYTVTFINEPTKELVFKLI